VRSRERAIIFTFARVCEACDLALTERGQGNEGHAQDTLDEGAVSGKTERRKKNHRREEGKGKVSIAGKEDGVSYYSVLKARC